MQTDLLPAQLNQNCLDAAETWAELCVYNLGLCATWMNNEQIIMPARWGLNHGSLVTRTSWY